MYRNPLGGDLSDYNSLKKQRDNGARVKKYEKIKLETKPNELQKYYQYLTYQQPILDDLNYIAERMRNEDINKQKEDFNTIKDIHKEEETKLKDIANTEKDLTPELKNELFDEPQVIMDLMPTINTDLELELEIRDIPEKERQYNDSIILDLDAGKPNKKKSKKLLLEDMKNGLTYNQPLLLENKKGKGKKLYEEALKKYGLSTTISDTITDIKNKPIIKTLPAPSKAKELFTNIITKLPISTDLQRKKTSSINSTIASQAQTETQVNIPRNKRGGRPKGSKNKPKGKTLDIRPTTLNL